MAIISILSPLTVVVECRKGDQRKGSNACGAWVMLLLRPSGKKSAFNSTHDVVHVRLPPSSPTTGIQFVNPFPYKRHAGYTHLRVRRRLGELVWRPRM